MVKMGQIRDKKEMMRQISIYFNVINLISLKHEELLNNLIIYYHIKNVKRDENDKIREIKRKLSIRDSKLMIYNFIMKPGRIIRVIRSNWDI